MITIDLSGSDKTYKEALYEHARDISTEVVNSVCYAIDNEIPEIYIVNIVANGIIYAVKTSKSFYKETLKIHIDSLIVFEDYELCAKAKKYIDRLP